MTSISGNQAENVLTEFHHISTAADYVARGGSNSRASYAARLDVAP
jgi:hypothetical protein